MEKLQYAMQKSKGDEIHSSAIKRLKSDFESHKKMLKQMLKVSKFQLTTSAPSLSDFAS
jgi:hypothetical protein